MASKLLILMVIVVVLSACGHRKPPSGGPVDTTPPEVLSVDPAPLDELGGRITVVFSKPIDRTSVLTGVKLYPLVLDRKLRWPDPQTMVIDLRERLADNTNYTLWLGRDLKDTHGNALEEPQTYIFRHGELQQGRIAGTFDWVDPAHANLPVRLDLFTADSIFIAGWDVQGASFAIDHLNVAPHLLRAWGDLEGDGRYKYGVDPRADAFTDSTERVSLTLTMAVEDTLPPKLKSASSPSERQIEVVFGEPLRDYEGVELVGVDSTAVSQPVTHAALHESQLSLLSTPAPAGRYMIRMTGLTDLRGNRTAADSIFFDSRALPDSLAPTVLSVSPRNGAVLPQPRPELTVRFSEIIPAEGATFHLFNDETDERLGVEVVSGDSDVYVLRPAAPLAPFTPCRLEVEALDAAGNPLDGERAFRWIYIPPQQ